MPDDAAAFLLKANEGVLATEAAFEAGWYTVCARSAYFAAFHAAIAALLHAGIHDRRREWDHAYVQAAFAEQLINRRKMYPAHVRAMLKDNHSVRLAADYQPAPISRRQASEALKRCQELCSLVSQRLQRDDQGVEDAKGEKG